jgi:trehalose/maltose hydrolase-like predicted phosphorylase
MSAALGPDPAMRLPPQPPPGAGAPFPAALDRSFRAIVVDGRAVEDAADFRARIERLLRAGVDVVVVAGPGGPGDGDAGLASSIRGPHKRRLRIAAAGGAGIHGFDEASRPVLIARRDPVSGAGGLADVLALALRSVIEPARISLEDLLVIGRDPAGLGANLPAPGAVHVSVGTSDRPVPALPAGGRGPPAVLELGGGEERLRAILAAQASRRPLTLAVLPTADPRWVLVEEGLSLAREHEIESLFSVANGAIGARGSLAEGTRLSRPDTFVAGVFARTDGTPSLVRTCRWTHLEATVAGRPVRTETGTILEHRRVLDLRRGLFFREWRHCDPTGAVTSIRGLRLASLARRDVLIQSVTFTPENFGGEITIRAAVEASAAGAASTDGRTALVLVRPAGAPVVAFAAASGLEAQSGAPCERRVEADGRWAIEEFRVALEVGKTYRLDRLIAVRTSRDAADPAAAALTALERLANEGADALIAAHVRAWDDVWDAVGIEVEGDAEAERALRFAAYHLTAAANPDDERVSIGARGLTGDAYGGHVFWDTEIFMLPFLVATEPRAARAALMYRWHTLGAARARAARGGWRGALFAWESADTGEDVTPPLAIAPDGTVVPILCGELEHHVSADVAFGALRYWRETGDDDFLLAAGAEIVFETARFFAARSEPGEDGLRHIRRVIGPDEYHEAVDDDAYTNLMARWNLEQGAELAALLAARFPGRYAELAARLGLGPAEVDGWRRAAREMYTGFDPRTGLFEQFRGYFALEEVDLAALEPRSAAVDVVLGRERVAGSKVIKQADVVMAIHLLWDAFSPAVRAANFAYYEPRTAHGSSLSPPIHAAVAARLGETDCALRYFRETAAIDLADNMGNAAGGVHLAAQGGLWQALVLGFAGLEEARAGAPAFGPRMPRGWRRVRFRLARRGRRWEVTIAGGRAEVTEVPLRREGGR